MSIKSRHLIILAVIIFIVGCANLQEACKVFWGSSTKALEKARAQGLSETFQCPHDDCFNSTIDIINKIGAKVFIKNKKEHLIVAMNFEGFIDTTEVGVFFTETTKDKTQVEISSLSSDALEYASQQIFSELAKLYPSNK